MEVIYSIKIVVPAKERYIMCLQNVNFKSNGFWDMNAQKQQRTIDQNFSLVWSGDHKCLS